MRTVLALLLLAVAANCYTLKSGGLKGSWATGVAVTGPADDMLAPTISNFVIDDTAEDFMYNATDNVDGSFYVYFDYDSTDAGYTHSCSLTSTLWDDTGAEVAWLDTDSNSYYLGRWLPQGEYVTNIECVDFTGNMGWWDSATSTSVYSILYANHQPDVTAFDVSNFQVEGGTSAISYVITDTVADDYYTITFDYDTVTPAVDNDNSYVWMATVGGSWTATGSSTQPWTTTAACGGGSCTGYLYVTRDSTPGVYSLDSGMIWDQAGNVNEVNPTTPILVTVSENAHTQTVVSCQTLVLNDVADIPDVTSTSDYFGVTLGCTLKSDVTGADAYITYIKSQLVQMNDNGVSTFESGGKMAYSDSSRLSLVDGSLDTDIDISFGSPAGPYSLQEVTTHTDAGMGQTYTLDLGSASSAAPSVAALLVAAAVALLRL